MPTIVSQVHRQLQQHNRQPIAEWIQGPINASGLKWTFTGPDQKVVFMDLNISIKKDAFSINLYEKPMALHLYTPPHSCHPPGCFCGLIRGMVLRVYRLCSKQTDITFSLKKFIDIRWKEAILTLLSHLHLNLPSNFHLLNLYQRRLSPPTKCHVNIRQEHFVPSFEVQFCWSFF